MAIDTLPTAPDITDASTLESRFSGWLAALDSFGDSVETEGALITGGLPAIYSAASVPLITDIPNFASKVNGWLFSQGQFFQSLKDFSEALPGGEPYPLPAVPDISDRSTFNSRMQAWVDALKHENWPAAVEALVP